MPAPCSLDELEVVGFAADHRAKGDQGIEAAAPGHDLQGQRRFEGAGHGGDGDGIAGNTETLQLGGA